MNIIKPNNKQEAVLLAETAMRITAEELQKEFESYFADDLETAQAKIMELTSKMPDGMLDTCLLQDNRLYLYSILMDNSIEEIIADLDNLIRIEK